MTQPHDPKRQIDSLRDVLSQDKTPLGLFLGAGCPTAIKDDENESLIPAIAGLTKTVCEQMNEAEEHKENFQILISCCKADGCNEPNIEEILDKIRNFQSAAGQSEVRGLTAKQLDELDQAICEEIFKVMYKSLPSEGTPYHKLAAWISSTERSHPIEIFTTNYDLLIEQALEEKMVPFFDGFVGSKRTFFDTQAMNEALPSRWARLWKIHGSINWRYEKDKPITRGEKKPEGEERRVIHPSHLKYSESRKMPYLAMLDRLRIYLKSSTPVLVTCGYSFGDEHLNEVIVQGLQGNPNAAVFALLFSPLEKYGNALKLAQRRANLSLLAKDAAVIGTRQAEWGKASVGDEKAVLGLRWKAVENVKDPKKVEFTFGDFKEFGDFLEDLIGDKKMATTHEE